ncbi:hypothetical protein [Streptomyces sp. Iso 434]|uniref:hypothetical protein n=1 Tax=Streptomyces sp. Iso 434 TaxID=3062272 RepID=UPI00397FDB5A
MTQAGRGRRRALAPANIPAATARRTVPPLSPGSAGLIDGRPHEYARSGAGQGIYRPCPRHPLSLGVGVSLALLDAAELALALTRHPTVADAVHAYERTMLPRSHAAQALPDGAAEGLLSDESHEGPPPHPEAAHPGAVGDHRG